MGCPQAIDFPDELQQGFTFFEYYSGLTIWHSKDLINWFPVTNE